jgi:hypothetical protein
MSKAIPYLIQGKNIIMVVDGRSHTISQETHIAYERIVEALKAEDWDALRGLVDLRATIADYSQGNVTIEGEHVLWNGIPFHNAVATRMIEMFKEGFSIKPMVYFMENLMNNSSQRSIDQLYGFLEKNSLPITEDGYFLAYKKVNDNYTDIHTGKIDNSVGQIVEMNRDLVDDNPDSHCSTGLHFCSEEYLRDFGGSGNPVMILKISPADVVSIPSDANGAKGRCCAYEVVAQVQGDPKDAFDTVVNSDYNDDSNDYNPSNEELYDVVRERDGIAVLESTTLEEAWELVEKHIRHKKAKLIVLNQDQQEVDQDGNTIEDDDVWQDEDFSLEDEEFEDDQWPDIDTNEPELYDVVRVYGEDIEYTGLTLDEARDMVEKNQRNKKAKLMIVNPDTGEVVE